MRPCASFVVAVTILLAGGCGGEEETPAPRSLRLLPSPWQLVGAGHDACSHGASPGGMGARWCAVSRPAAADADKQELWVFDLAAAVRAGGARCDGTTPTCVRLSSDLWTGQTLAAQHPYVHRFEGDTLIFHAELPAGRALENSAYEGPIWAWRPGWQKPRQLTSGRGMSCHAEHRSTVAHCLDAPEFEKSDSLFIDGTPGAFDLRAGRLVDADGALPVLGRVKAYQGRSIAWQASFSPRGDLFAFSHVPTGATEQVLFVVETDRMGTTEPRSARQGVSQWKIGNDGRRIYFLSGLDVTQSRTGIGKLTAADFPSGANPVHLQDDVTEFEVLGTHDDLTSDDERGVAFVKRDPASKEMVFGLIGDPGNNPSQVTPLGVDLISMLVSMDGKHAVFFRPDDEEDDQQYSLAHLLSVGNASCQLSVNSRAESFGPHFSDGSKVVFWSEVSSEGLHEGWFSPAAGRCQPRWQYSTRVSFMLPVGDELMVFGDEEAELVTLKYARLDNPGPRDGGLDVDQVTVKENVENRVAAVRAGAGLFLVFVVNNGDQEADDGVHVHGPISLGPETR